MAKHKDLKTRTTHFKRGLAIATVLLTMIASLQISAASAVEPEPALIKNINQTTQDSFSQSASDNEGSVVIGSTLYFSVAGGLWKSNGTPAGTELVKQFDPRDNDRISLYVMGDNLYFAANDGVHGLELWKSNGTSAGTVLLEDINPGSGGSDPFEFEQMGGALYFFVLVDGGPQLWKSTGLEGEGETLRYRTNEAQDVGELTAVGTSLFFWGLDGTNGFELWTSEGPAGSTVMIKNIRGEDGLVRSSEPAGLTALGNTLYFRANGTTTANNIELWKSDGTEDGTVLLKNINPGDQPSGPSNFIAVGETMFFRAFDGTSTELWKSNGTDVGTVMVSDPGSINLNNGSLSGKIVKDASGLNVYFVESSAQGRRMWKSNGTRPVFIEDLTSYGLGAQLVAPTFIGDDLYTVAGEGNFYGNLWKYVDGPNSPGLTQVRATNSSRESNNDLQILNAAGTNLFLMVNTPEFGRELWKSDGTTNGTALLKDINTVDNSGYELDDPTSTAFLGNTFFFEGVDGLNGSELWKSDGTEDGTRMVKDINPGSAGSWPSNFVVLNDSLFFTASDVDGTSLWKSDGSEEGTQLVRAFIGESSPSSFVVMGDYLFFSADNGTDGSRLWRSDGKVDGVTEMVQGPLNQLWGNNPGNLVVINQTLFLSAEDADNNRNDKLWKSTGNGTTTAMALVLGQAGLVDADNLVAVNNKLFFTARDLEHGEELWAFDGTTGAALRVKDVNPILNINYSTDPATAEGASSSPSKLVAVGTKLFFQANDGANGTELWVSDGTSEGTSLVKDIQVGAYGSYPTDLVAFENNLFFSVDDAVNGRELWKSNGSDVGTVMVIDNNLELNSGTYPSNLVVVGDTLFFSADYGDSRQALWKTDGTAAGTLFIKDFYALGDSYLRKFRGSTDRLYFGADSGQTGTELWSISLASVPGGGSQPSGTDSGNSYSETPTPTPTPTPPVVEEPATTKVVRFSQFAGDSAKLPARATRAIGVSLRPYSSVERVVCTGFTSGSQATVLGRKIALQRAQNACNVVRLVAPKALIQVRANVAGGVGPKFRTVQLSITGN
jgi:ELWxxDGT repeat protein